MPADAVNQTVPPAEYAVPIASFALCVHRGAMPGPPKARFAARRIAMSLLRLQPGHLRVVCVADRSPKPAVQLAALEDDLLGMHRFLAPIGHEPLVPNFDRLSHDPPSRTQSSVAVRCISAPSSAFDTG